MIVNLSKSTMKSQDSGFSSVSTQSISFLSIGLALVLVIQLIAASLGTDQLLVRDLLVRHLSVASAGSIFPSAVDKSTGSAVLSVVSRETITFQTQNGRTINEKPPQAKEIPHLVLKRNGNLTESSERTLVWNLAGIDVPPGGVTVTLKVETQHPDPDLGSGSRTRIPVAEASQWISNTSAVTETQSAVFNIEFDDMVHNGTGSIPTPTGYYRYEIAVEADAQANSSLLYDDNEDFAFLLENQWITPLAGLREEVAGAAPDELVVYYADMFPYQRDSLDPNSRMPRSEVDAYVQNELVPAMVDAVYTQTDNWDFPWRQGWSSYRQGGDAERLSVALTQGGTWFHGRAPSTAHSGISINVESKEFSGYDTLTDGIMSVFHHELFHNLQRNINLDAGWDGEVDGAHEDWSFITEGTALLASTVGQSQAEFGLEPEKRSYMSKANVYLAGDEFYEDDLNTSYKTMDPYRLSLYWRFLYEQYNQASAQVGDPQIGMQVIRQTLNALYAKANFNSSSSIDPVKRLPAIIDQAFASTPHGPFRTYRESLIHFAQAVYALHLENGRWDGTGSPVGPFLYDPNNAYKEPRIETITYSGDSQSYTDGIGASFGIDFVDVVLEKKVNGRSLVIEFSAGPNSQARFNLQVWKLQDKDEGDSPQAIAAQAESPEVVGEFGSRGNVNYTIPEIDTGSYDRLGLIITRVDVDEDQDPNGIYTIRLH
jgi:hypothetical protein